MLYPTFQIDHGIYVQNMCSDSNLPLSPAVALQVLLQPNSAASYHQLVESKAILGKKNIDILYLANQLCKEIYHIRVKGD